MPTSKLIVAAALLDSLTEPRQLLVARRSAPESLAGLWEFPGGKVEQGEAVEEALKRELLEELGIQVRLGSELLPQPSEQRLLDASSVPSAANCENFDGVAWPLAGNAVMRLWLASIVSGEPEPLEDHDELRWVDLDQPSAILGLAWIPADLPIVAELLRVLS